MKGGAAMNQQEFEKKIKESEEIRERAMKMAEAANELMDKDLRLSNEMFIESMGLWCRGCEMRQQALDEAFASGSMEVTEDALLPRSDFF